MMMQTILTSRFRRVAAFAAGLFVVATVGATQQTSVPAPQLQQPTEVSTTITGEPGMRLRLAVPDFIALSTDAETVDAAKTIGRVLWDDLNFEREFDLISRDVLETVPAASSIAAVPFDRWRELNADGIVVGTVQKTKAGVEIEVRLFNVRTQQSAFGTKYSGAVASKRSYAHRVSDDIHRQQRGLQGVAQTKLTFSSDRTGERLGGSVENRGVREIMIADYDGENAQRVTTDRNLNIAPVWSPDARSIAYTSYRRGPPNIFVANIYEGTNALLTDVKSQNMLPAWSPDGRRIAFASMRDGNGSEIYVMNRDGSNLRRLTNNRSDDITPAWSPSGTHIAFTSDRTGTSQVWEMDSEGLGQRQLTRESKADRATWSLAPFNQIAFAAQTGPGNDIKILDMTTGSVRQLTFGEGTNESPVFAPNGRHIAFISTRVGKEQIFTMDTDGKNVRQITRNSSNKYPNWSQGPRN